MGEQRIATKSVNPNVADLDRIANANWKNDYLAGNGKAIKRGCFGGRFFQAIFCCSKSCPAPDKLHNSRALAAIEAKIKAVTADSSVDPKEAISLIAKVSKSLDALAAKANTSRRAVAVATQGHLLDVATLAADSRAKVEIAEKAEAERQAQALAATEAALKEAAAPKATAPATDAAAPRADAAHVDGSSSDDEAVAAPRAGSPLKTSPRAMAMASALVEGLQAEEGMRLRRGKVVHHMDLRGVRFNGRL